MGEWQAMILLEVLFVLSCILGAWFVKRKNRIGWLFWDIGNVLGITVFTIREMYIMIIPYVIYSWINTTAYFKWGKE